MIEARGKRRDEGEWSDERVKTNIYRERERERERRRERKLGIERERERERERGERVGRRNKREQKHEKEGEKRGKVPDEERSVGTEGRYKIQKILTTCDSALKNNVRINDFLIF